MSAWKLRNVPNNRARPSTFPNTNISPHRPEAVKDSVSKSYDPLTSILARKQRFNRGNDIPNYAAT